MAYPLTPPLPGKAGNRWLKAFGLAAVLVLVVSLLGGYWLLHYGRPRAGSRIESSLLVVIDRGQVAPRLVLLPLADYPAEQAWQEPLRGGEAAGALALWLFGPIDEDRRSIEALLTIATMQQQSDTDGAAASLLAAADIARITPDLSDRERAEILVHIGEQMRDLGLPASAVTEWRQAAIIARWGPALPGMFRATLLHDVAALYAGVGATRMANQARLTAAQVSMAESALEEEPRPSFATMPLPDEPAELQAARERRRRAAEEVARHFGGSTAERAYSELRNALDAEGFLHRQWIREELRLAPAPARRAALYEYHIEWLQRERMLARGLGGEAFDAWEMRRPEIELELHEAWEELDAIREEQSIESGIQEQATVAQRAWWATRLVQARLERDPALDLQQFAASMRPNQANQAGGPALRLDLIQGRFWRVPASYVGTDTLPD